MKTHRTPERLLPVFLLAFACSAGAVIPDDDPDASKPLDVKADKMDADQKKEISTFTGNVVVTQGRFTLIGNRMVVKTREGRLADIMVYGNPAHFKKYDYKHKSWVNGEAMQIHYVTEPVRTLTLLKNAKVVRANGERMSGETIHYRLKTHTVEVKGGKQGGRVHIVLPQAK